MALPPLHPDDVTILDACAGFGMLGEAVLFGLERLGLPGRVVGHIERDSAAAAALVARMEASPVDRAPVYSDLATFDGRRWRGCVDVFAAGLPCQPYSPAGKRVGNLDHRSHGDDGDGPVPHALRIIDESGPALVFFENVPAWVVGGHFRSVGDELCRMGYAIEDPLFVAAGDVGAPHERERVFILAHRDGAALRGTDDRRPDARANGRNNAGGRGEVVADRERDGRSGIFGMPRGVGQPLSAHSGEGLAYAADDNCTEHEQAAGERPSRRAPHGSKHSQHHSQLANGNGAGRGTSGRANRQRADADTGGMDLGDALLSRSQGARSAQPRRRSGAGDAGDQLDNAVGSAPWRGRRAEAQGAEQGHCRRQGYLHGSGSLPLFPPGRGDEHDPDHADWWAWAAVAAVDPSLMPRVQPKLSMVADGLAFSRADLLRIGGNGVVAVAAAYAFAALLGDVFDRAGG